MPANPIRSPGEWNVFRVASVPLPGIATVTGCVKAHKIDVAKGKGASGGGVSYEGKDPKPFKVILHLLTEEDLDEWDTGEGRRILETPLEGKNAKAPAMDHPACQYAEIKAATMVSASQPEPVGDGSWKVTIEMQPWAPKKPASGSAGGSKTHPGGNGGGSNAQSKADELMAELEKQLKEAAA